MTRVDLRWRLARWVAPEPIMADPAPGRESFVVHRTFGDPSMQLTVALDTLDITTAHQLGPTGYVGAADDELPMYAVGRLLTTVTGTAVS